MSQPRRKGETLLFMAPYNIRCSVKFVTAVCILFLFKLKWPKNKSFYEKGGSQVNLPCGVKFMAKMQRECHFKVS